MSKFNARGLNLAIACTAIGLGGAPEIIGIAKADGPSLPTLEAQLKDMRTRLAPQVSPLLVNDADLRVFVSTAPILDALSSLNSLPDLARTINIISTQANPKDTLFWYDGSTWCNSFVELAAPNSLGATVKLSNFGGTINPDGSIGIHISAAAGANGQVHFQFKGKRINYLGGSYCPGLNDGSTVGIGASTNTILTGQLTFSSSSLTDVSYALTLTSPPSVPVTARISLGRTIGTIGVLTSFNPSLGTIASGTFPLLIDQSGQYTAPNGVVNQYSLRLAPVSFTSSSTGISANWVTKATFSKPLATDPIGTRRAFWESKALTCPGSLPFPSKQTGELQPCDDGDMTLFNGLLCAAGDSRGCKGVADAQDIGTGEWFRSPRIRLLGKNDRGGAQFSPDMALGVQLYLVQTKDIAAAARWIAWLQGLPTTKIGLGDLSPAAANSPAIPSDFVSNPQMALLLKSVVQPLLSRFNSEFDLGTILARSGTLELPNFCTTDAVDDPHHLACAIRPGDAATLAETFAYLEKTSALGPLPAGVLKDWLGRFAGTANDWDLGGAIFNKPGYSQHLAGVGALLLRRMDQGDQTTLQLASEILPLWPDNSENAFFDYLSSGPGPKLDADIIDRCPSQATSLKAPLYQWQWERSVQDKAWEQSSLWDCIFASELRNLPKLP